MSNRARAALQVCARRNGPKSQTCCRSGSPPTSAAASFQVVRLVGVDHWHHEGLIAFSRAPQVPIGVVEYVRLDDFDIAGPAIIVADD